MNLVARANELHVEEWQRKARAFLAPYEKLSDEFLQLLVDAQNGMMTINNGYSLTPHVAATVLRFRALLAEAS